MSMPTITLISPSKTTLISHPPEIRTNTRDASFSSYLDGAEESFVLKLGNKSTQNDHVFLGKKSDDDVELDVFGAEKYFNESADHNPKPVIPKNHQLPITTHHRRPKKDELALEEIFAIKPPQRPKQLSIRSESSCNSRSSLLQAVSRNQQQQQQPNNNKKKNKKLGFLARIGCKCSCADKSSVVDETDRFGDSVKLELGRIRGGGAHFAKRPTKSPLQQVEKKLAMMTTWDAIVSPAEEIKTIPSICSDMRGGGDESDGAASDASSDLFEIESLSRGWGGSHLNQTSAATTCYAPSEASVEWSVVTASAADFEEPVGSDPRKTGPHKEMTRLRTGILASGCMSKKAVRVVGGGRNLRTESFTSARFHDEEIKFNR